MEILPLEIPDAWVAKFDVHRDARGCFHEWFKLSEIEMLTGFQFNIEQANISTSKKGVIRGLHYSLSPQGQAKWLTCVSGKILDVIVDIRLGSPTFGKFVTIEIDSSSSNAIFIGPGLAHGFSVLEENTAVAYLLSSPYSPSHEHAINPFDPQLKIDWKLSENNIVISQKDLTAPTVVFLQESHLLPIY